jgi:hypothetical protein
MSENFPWNTVEEFFDANTRKEVERMPATVNLSSPPMPDITPTEKAGAGLAIAGVLAFIQSDDTNIQLATIICSTIITLGVLASNAYNRGKRNDRIAEENTQTISSAEQIHISEVLADSPEE